MASFIPNAVSYIYYADRLNQLPQGVIGTAIGTVLLPLISKQVNDYESIAKMQSKALSVGLILIIPTTAAFIIIPDIILLTLFDHYAVRQTAPTLIALYISLPAFIINKELLLTFFAKGNLKMPTIFSLMCLGINVVLNLLLMHKYQHTGIAIATSISTWINSTLLINYLTINKMHKISQVLLLNIVKILIATLVMSIVLYVSSSLSSGLFLDKIFARVIHLAALIFLSVVVYFGTLYGQFKVYKTMRFSIYTILSISLVLIILHVAATLKDWNSYKEHIVQKLENTYNAKVRIGGKVKVSLITPKLTIYNVYIQCNSNKEQKLSDLISINKIEVKPSLLSLFLLSLQPKSITLFGMKSSKENFVNITNEKASKVDIIIKDRQVSLNNNFVDYSNIVNI
jgi:hypothetical protein